MWCLCGKQAAHREKGVCVCVWLCCDRCWVWGGVCYLLWPFTSAPLVRELFHPVCLSNTERASSGDTHQTDRKRERERERERERDMSVSTQLGLLLWKNFTYRRRQTVSHTCTCTHCCTCIITFFLIHKNDLMETDLHLWKKKAAGIWNERRVIQSNL